MQVKHYEPATIRGQDESVASVWQERLSDGSFVYNVHVHTDGGWQVFANAIDEDAAIKAADILKDAYRAAYGL